MDLSVIIVNWNTCNLLAQCLEAVYFAIQGVQLEVLVVDNGSRDGSPAMVRESFAHARLIQNKANLGFACANNQAIRISRGRYILLLNSDAFLNPNVVEEMVRLMKADKTVGIVGPGLVYPDGRSQVSHGPLPNYWTELSSLVGLDKLFHTKNGGDKYFETGAVSGACMLIRKELLDRIGLLDESFFMFSEEVDLCKRCHEVGYKVIHIPYVQVMHVGGGSTGTTPKRMTYLYSGKLLYFKKHFGPAAEKFLRYTIRTTTFLKGCIYRVVRSISRGHIKKDEFWWSVSKEISTLSL
jgi:GT2 family glycosyltransferase